jgi:hypothetical protein
MGSLASFIAGLATGLGALPALFLPSLSERVQGCVDLSFEPKESTDEIEKTQEVPGQFVKTRK